MPRWSAGVGDGRSVARPQPHEDDAGGQTARTARTARRRGTRRERGARRARGTRGLSRSTRPAGFAIGPGVGCVEEVGPLMSVPRRLCARWLASVALALGALRRWPGTLGGEPSVRAATCWPGFSPTPSLQSLRGGVAAGEPRSRPARRCPRARLRGAGRRPPRHARFGVGRWAVLALADFGTDLASGRPRPADPPRRRVPLMSVDGAAHRTFVRLIMTGAPHRLGPAARPRPGHSAWAVPAPRTSTAMGYRSWC